MGNMARFGSTEDRLHRRHKNTSTFMHLTILNTVEKVHVTTDTEWQTTGDGVLDIGGQTDRQTGQHN